MTKPTFLYQRQISFCCIVMPKIANFLLSASKLVFFAWNYSFVVVYIFFTFWYSANLKQFVSENENQPLDNYLPCWRHTIYRRILGRPDSSVGKRVCFVWWLATYLFRRGSNRAGGMLAKNVNENPCGMYEWFDCPWRVAVVSQSISRAAE